MPRMRMILCLPLLCVGEVRFSWWLGCRSNRSHSFMIFCMSGCCMGVLKLPVRSILCWLVILALISLMRLSMNCCLGLGLGVFVDRIACHCCFAAVVLPASAVFSWHMR